MEVVESTEYELMEMGGNFPMEPGLIMPTIVKEREFEGEVAKLYSYRMLLETTEM